MPFTFSCKTKLDCVKRLYTYFLLQIEEEAKVKGYTEEELNREIDLVREKLVKEIYK